MRIKAETMILGDGSLVRVISRPMEHLSSADIVKLHAQGKPVPMLEFTLVRVE